MAGFIGADIEQLRALGNELTRQAEELESVISRLTSRITSVDWRGPDAQRFTSDWHDRLAGMLRSAATLFRDAAAKVMEDARQQESASGAGSSGPKPGRLFEPLEFSDFTAPVRLGPDEDSPAPWVGRV